MFPLNHVNSRKASKIKVDVIGGATCDSVQDYIKDFGSAGLVSPQEGIITDGGGETIDTLAFVGSIRKADSHVSDLLFFNLEASSGNAIPTDSIRYIGVEYNNGSPQIVLKASDSWNNHDEFPLGSVVNESGTLHIINNPQHVGNFGAHALERFYQTFPLKRDDRKGGLILGETGTRRVTMTAGHIWDRVNEFQLSAIDTTPTGDTFDSYSSNGLESSADTQWDNQNYDAEGSLTEMNVNQYANLWFYIESDGDLVCVYGTDQYATSSMAEAEGTPQTIPDRLVVAGKLIGRIIFRKSAATAEDIQSVFETVFAVGAGVSTHNNLSGLQGGTVGEYFHNTSAESTELVNWLSELDITTAAPATDDVLMYNGSDFVPTPEGTTFEFSILSFSDGISDTNQLIGAGEWSAIGVVSFTATYDNPPGGMTAEVALSGSASAWAGNLAMTPVTGPETNAEAVDYPSSAGGTIVFTLSQDADGTTDTESVSFNNTMRYGNSAQTIGNQTEATLEALTEVSGPSESRGQTISNISTTANYLVFGYADRLSDVAQVQRNIGFGYVTACFNSTRTTLAPSVQTGVASVDNSASYSETFACITSKDTGLANNTNDFKLLTSSSAIDYIYWGELNVDATADGGNVYTEANVKDNVASEPGQVGSNSISSRSMIVNAAVDEFTYIAYPSRLGALTSIVIGGFESITDFWIDAGSGTELAITNDAGYTENYFVYVSKNPGFSDPTTMVVST